VTFGIDLEEAVKKKCKKMLKMDPVEAVA